MGTPLSSARDSGLWVETATGVFTRINTDTSFSFTYARDKSDEDYRGAAFKRSYLGGLTIDGTVNISRTETDLAFDKLEAAVISGEAVNVQERNPAGIKMEASVYAVSMTPTHGLNESSKYVLNISVADSFEYHATEVAVGSGS